MRKTQIYFSDEDLRALHRAAAARHCSVASLVREAVRQVHAPAPTAGPVAVWDGEPRRTSVDHDSIYDERGCEPRPYGTASAFSSTQARRSRWR